MELYDAYGRPIRASQVPSGLDVFFSTSEIPPLTGWDVASAKAAADAHDQGDLTLSGRMYWSMLSDPRVADGVGKHALAVRGLPHEIRAGKGQAAKTVRAAWERYRPRALPDAVQSELWSQALLLGPAVGQPIWQYDNDGEINPRTGRPWYVPVVDPWEPTSLQATRGLDMLGNQRERLHARVWGSLKKEGTWEDVPIIPGTGQWLCFSLAGASRPWLFGKLRTLWRYWISRQMAMLLWLRFNDIHGIPIREVQIPMGMRKTPEGQDFYRDVQAIGRDAALLSPQMTDGKNGVKLNLIEAKSESWKSLQAQLGDYGREITIDLTGGTQNTEAEGGNYKGAEEQREIRHEVKAAGARAWQAFENAQLAIPFAVLNGYAPDEAAEVIFDVTPPANEQADAEAAKAGGEALVALALAQEALARRGYEVPMAELAAAYGRKLPPGKVVKAQPLEPAAPEKSSAPPKKEAA